MRSFAELPGQIAALTREHERVAVVLLDAFGWDFVQRHSDHPLLRRMAIEPVASQFPSTTAAHLTTLYTGLPVAEHGLYEWQIYEPSLDRMILPLPFVDALDGKPLALDPRELVPGPTFFEQLDVPVTALQPQAIWPSTYSSAALQGAAVIPYASFEDAAAQLDRPGLTYLYWDGIDAAGHRHGPSSREFDAAIVAALDALERHLPRGTLLVTADHGQIDVADVDLLDDVWPDLPAHAAARRLRPRLLPARRRARDRRRGTGGPARASAPRSTSPPTLFPDAGPRLRARLADVARRPRPAGWRGWARTRAGSCASREITAGARRKRPGPGPACSRFEMNVHLERSS